MMGINYELAAKAEKIARRLAREAGQPEELCELFLPDAYEKIASAGNDDDG